MSRLKIELIALGIAMHLAFFGWQYLHPPTELPPLPVRDAQQPPLRYSDTCAALLARTERGAEALPLRHTQVDAEVVGVMSMVRVEQVFANDGERALDATYVFPLPEGAAVHAMTLQVGDRRIAAQIRRRAEARSTYEAARAQGRTAALLEQQRPNVFAWDVANIRPGDRVVVSLEYAQELVPTRGRYEWVFPMTVGPRYRADEVAGASVAAPLATRSGRDVGVTLALHTGSALRGLSSVTHAAAVQQGPHGEGRVVLSAEDAIPNRDMVVRWSLAGDAPRATLLARPDPAGGGHFLLMVQPRAVMTLGDMAPRDFVFVVDTSGSMEGVPIARAKSAIRRALAAVRPEDRFQIVRFAGDASAYAPTPRTATPAEVSRALAWLDGLEGGGGTEFLPALELAFAQPRAPGHARVVVFMTDGYIGYESDVLAWLHAHAREANVFAMGVGSSVNRYLIDGMARVGRGRPFVLLDQEDEAAVVDDLVATIARPALTDLSLTWEGLSVRDVTPERAPDLFADRPVVVTGRYDRPGRGALTLRGMLAGRPYVETLALDLTTSTGASERGPLAYLWARRRIDDLSDAHTFSPPDLRAPIEQRITELALEYHLMSAYTSFVAVDERARGSAATERVVVPAELPAGVSPAMMGEAPAAQPTIALSQDQVAPGDPELAVRAPARTRSVTAALPWGETLALRHDVRRALWVANFVVPHDAAEGVQVVRVTLTLDDGSRLTRTARLRVDGRPPAFTVSAPSAVCAGCEVVVSVAAGGDAAPVPRAPWTDVGSGTFDLRARREVARVEVMLPDGRVLAAAPRDEGRFELRFRAPRTLGEQALDLVALDAAGNASRATVRFAVVAE